MTVSCAFHTSHVSLSPLHAPTLYPRSPRSVDDWWDDEPTTSEAELARFQLIGRTLSPVVAAAVTAAVLTSSAPFGAAAVPMVAAACSGAFMFQRNVHQARVGIKAQPLLQPHPTLPHPTLPLHSGPR